jgi:hypothetical protein
MIAVSQGETLTVTGVQGAWMMATKASTGESGFVSPKVIVNGKDVKSRILAKQQAS